MDIQTAPLPVFFGCGASLTDSPAEGWIHRDLPLVEQPLWYVAPIPVALAPRA